MRAHDQQKESLRHFKERASVCAAGPIGSIYTPIPLFFPAKKRSFPMPHTAFPPAPEKNGFPILKKQFQKSAFAIPVLDSETLCYSLIPMVTDNDSYAWVA